MPEKRTIVDGLTIQYEGLFNFNDLYDVIEHWTKENGYDKGEAKNYEQVLKDGRDVMVELTPWKSFSDYARIQHKIVIHAKKMKDVVVKKDKMDVKMNQGKVVIEFTGYFITDYAGRWEGKPIFYLLRAIIDKWVYPVNTSKFEGAVSEEVNMLYRNVKGYLNMNRY